MRDSTCFFIILTSAWNILDSCWTTSEMICGAGAAGGGVSTQPQQGQYSLLLRCDALAVLEPKLALRPHCVDCAALP